MINQFLNMPLAQQDKFIAGIMNMRHEEERIRVYNRAKDHNKTHIRFLAAYDKTINSCKNLLATKRKELEEEFGGVL